jgi:hypothetical protein
LYASKILHHCCSKDLDTFSISCKELPDKCLTHIAKNNTSNLVVVSLLGCRKITSDCVITICKSNQKMYRFSLGTFSDRDGCFLDNSALQGDGIASLPELSSLHIQNATEINKFGLEEVVKRNKNLRFLTVTNCGISHKDLFKYCPSAKRFMTLGNEPYTSWQKSA